ncbi:hypothetical protein GGR53DRAFT_525876 [Hypoxylon sp. FL1150]|nr:hypothetical protein GGR53DRAFT_525876 [Hypoxylon sp. FL1150]
MAPKTIRAVLREPLPETWYSVNPGTNTVMDNPVRVLTCHDWPEFSHKNLYPIFKEEILEEYDFGKHGPLFTPLSRSRYIVDEATLEDYIRPVVFHPVNCALDQENDPPFFGRGSIASFDAKRPDSALVFQVVPGDTRYANRLPGETKLSTKFTYGVSNEAEHEKVLGQAATYMALAKTRYGFIITDAFVYPLRLRLVQISSGLASGRSLRQTGNPAILISDTSVMSEGSMFVDENPLDQEYELDVGTVRLSEDRKATLCGKEALWYLAQLSKGPTDIRSRYPLLNSWRRKDGRRYIHNTSGEEKSKLSDGDVVDETEQEDRREASESPTTATSQTGTADVPVFSQASSTFEGFIPGEPEYVEDSDGESLQGTETSSAVAEPSSTAAARAPTRYSERLRGKEKEKEKQELPHETVRLRKEGKDYLYPGEQGKMIRLDEKKWTQGVDGKWYRKSKGKMLVIDKWPYKR